MNNALLYLGGILITALAVLFAVPRFIDWNSYRGIFEEEATRILGREVRVGGDVNLRLLPAPFVSFEKLRISDIGDDGGNSIIRADSFTMWLSVPPLLRGVLEAHKVELKRPIINLAVNSEGTGNWRTLAVTSGAIPFAPTEVALQAVSVEDGAVIVTGPTRNELARFDDINGELSAEAIEGPFKFKGKVSWDGAPRQLRFATAKIDGNGDLRFKAAVEVTESANSYVLDAKLADLKDVPTLEGKLTAKLALAGGAKPVGTDADVTLAEPPAPGNATTVDAGSQQTSSEGQAQAPTAAPPVPAPAPAPSGPSGFELKANVKGTSLGVALDDIAISLDAGAMPQLISGQAKFGWAGKSRLEVDLKSRWLDLDKIASSTDQKMPLEAARSYFDALAAALPVQADTNATLEFDQLTLGGEPIANVRLAASRSGGPLELKGVRADLPGGVRLDLDGILTPADKVPRLDGTLFVSGKSLMRFLAWGLGKPAVGGVQSDGAFSLDGHFALGDGTLALTDATVEFSGTPLKGNLKLDLSDRRKLAVAIEGPRIDVAQFGSGLVDLGNLRRLLFGADGAAGAGEAPSSPTQFDPAAGDLSLNLKVAELVDGDRTLKNVDADIRLEAGRLSIPRLRFSTPEGFYLEAEGSASDVPANPKGVIRGLISAPDSTAARAFVSLLASESDNSELDRIAALAPFRLAGTLSLAGGDTRAAELAVDGTLGGGRLAASLRLDGGRAQWRSSPLDLTTTIDSPDVANLIAGLFDGKIGAPTATPGRIVVKAAGVPAEGLLAFADAKADGLSFRYRGQVRLNKPGEAGLDGDLKIAVSDARVALAAAGLGTAEGASGMPLSGTIDVHRDGAVLRLKSDSVAVGDSTLAGQVSVTAREDNGRTIDAALATNKASFAALLAPMLSSRDGQKLLEPVAAPAPPSPASRATPNAAPPVADIVIWPEQAFDFGLLDRTNGKITLTVDSLSLEPGLAIGNARLAAELSPQGIKVASLEGEAVGGRLISQFDLTRAPAGIALSGSARIDLASKPAATPGAPEPGDAVAFNVAFSSRALSPAAAIAGLTGKGELTIGDATLNGNSPAAVSAVVRAALTGQGPNGGAKLAEAIKAALKDGEVRLGKLSIPVEISDGALKLNKVQIDMPDGRSTFATAVELATMKIDSEWQIAPTLDKGLASGAARAQLPPVTVVYAGKLSELASLEPQVSAEALERELVVRKLEFDVGELERLRKIDEARARDDAARRQADEERARLDAERRKALEEDQWGQRPPPPPSDTADPNAVQRQDLTAPPGATTSDAYDNSVVGAGVPIERDIEAVAPPPAPTLAPSQTSDQRPKPRRKRADDDAWRPFENPY